MKILAIETATEACSVALWLDGQWTERCEATARGHSEYILPMVEDVLSEGGIPLSACDVLAYGKGPGSFTGLRIGVGVAQGLAFGANLSVVGVSSLAALAADAPAPSVLAAIDARMGQVYWACYQREPSGVVRLVGAESVSVPDAIGVRRGHEWWGVGSGWDAYATRIDAALGNNVVNWSRGRHPRAHATAELGAVLVAEGLNGDPIHAAPYYIRNQVTRT